MKDMKLSEWLTRYAWSDMPFSVRVQFRDEVAQLENKLEAWKEYASVLEFGEYAQIDAARRKLQSFEAATQDTPRS